MTAKKPLYVYPNPSSPTALAEFGSEHFVAIADGGTGATDAATARTNLDVYSKTDVDNLVTDASKFDSIFFNNTDNNPTEALTSLETFVDHYGSSGIIDGCEITLGTYPNINISAGTIYIRGNDESDSSIIVMPVNATNNLAVSPGLQYLYLDYNTGTPTFSLTTDPTVITMTDKIAHAIIFTTGGEVKLFEVGNDNVDSNAKLRKRLFYTTTFEKSIESSGTVSFSGLQFNASECKFWFGLSEKLVGAKVDEDTFDYWYNTNGTWTSDTATEISNTQYNDTTSGLADLGSNKYVNHWIYGIPISGEKFSVVYGTAQHNSLAEAAEESPPSLPDYLKYLGILYAVVTVKKDDTTITENRSAFTTTFSASHVTSHNELSDIGTNTHAEIDTHITNISNPHSVTKTQVGLDNVDNTSDLDKPISTATQTALDSKVDENASITGGTHTKITYDSKGLVTVGADATTADIDPSTDRNYVTDTDVTNLATLTGGGSTTLHSHDSYATVTSLNTHIGDTSNPHSVTAAQVGAVALTGDENIDGVKTFTSSPIVPETPTTDGQVASKKYVDDQNVFNLGVDNILGTANQIVSSNDGASVTLSLADDLEIGSNSGSTHTVNGILDVGDVTGSTYFPTSFLSGEPDDIVQHNDLGNYAYVTNVPAYGCMYISGIADSGDMTQNQWYQICEGDLPANFDGTWAITHEENLSIITDDADPHFLIEHSGRYEMNVAISFSATASQTVQWEFTVGIDTGSGYVTQEGIVHSFRSTSGAGSIGFCGLVCLPQLNAGAKLALFARKTSSTASGIGIAHINFLIDKKGV